MAKRYFIKIKNDDKYGYFNGFTIEGDVVTGSPCVYFTYTRAKKIKKMLINDYPEFKICLGKDDEIKNAWKEEALELITSLNEYYINNI